MRLVLFVLGVLVGLAIAPARGGATWRMLRDSLARLIDALLAVGLPRSATVDRLVEADGS
jgi:hypothetical protein